MQFFGPIRPVYVFPLTGMACAGDFPKDYVGIKWVSGAGSPDTLRFCTVNRSIFIRPGLLANPRNMVYLNSDRSKEEEGAAAFFSKQN